MQKAPTNQGFLELLAEWTGLEPATPGVTGRYSNQLNYHSMLETKGVAVQSNPGATLATPPGFEPGFIP